MGLAPLNLSLHKAQGRALMSRATEILYGGAAGGGKSHLMRAASVMAWCSSPSRACKSTYSAASVRTC
jgi:hypothetical protein